MKRFFRQHAATLILVVLAASGLLWLFLVDRGSVSTSEAEYRSRNLLPAWRVDEISGVTIVNHGKTAVLTLAPPDKLGQRLWSVEIDGKKVTASQQAVDQLFGTLEYAVFERRVPEGAVSAADLGFSEALLSIAVEMGPKKLVLRVGHTAPTPPDARYAEVEGVGAFVITAQLASALDVPFDGFRSRAFVPYLSTELAKLHVDGTGGAKHFKRASWGGGRGSGFRFDGSTPEGEIRANAEAFDKLLGALGTMQAEAFLSEEEARKTLSPAVTIRMFPSDAAKPEAELVVGGACPVKSSKETGPLVVAIRNKPEPMAVCVPEGALSALTADVASFADRSLIDAPLDEISEFEAEHDGEPQVNGKRYKLEMARKETNWHVRAPVDKTVEGSVGDAYLTAFLGLRTGDREDVDPASVGLDASAASIRVRSATPSILVDGGVIEREQELRIAEKDGVLRVWRQEDGLVFRMSTEARSLLFPTMAALRSPKVIEASAERIASIRVKWAAGAQRVERTASGWKLTEPAGQGLFVDAGLAENLAIEISKLSALRWAGEKDADGFGPAARITIEVAIAEKDNPEKTETVTLSLGGRGTEGVWMKKSGDPGAFLAGRDLEDAASGWLVDRGRMLVDRSSLAGVLVQGEGTERVEIANAQGTWSVKRPKNEAPRPDDAEVAARLSEAATGLMAEAVVHIGPPDKGSGLEKPRATVTLTLRDPNDASAKQKTLRISLGAGDSYQGVSIVYARLDGTDATYALAQAKARPFLEAAGAKAQ